MHGPEGLAGLGKDVAQGENAEGLGGEIQSGGSSWGEFWWQSCLRTKTKRGS